MRVVAMDYLRMKSRRIINRHIAPVEVCRAFEIETSSLFRYEELLNFMQ